MSQPAVSVGVHECDLCEYRAERSGAKNLFVPDGSRAFVCPELILHYMNAHQYKLPAEFCEAVLACPAMRCNAYRRALVPSGVVAATKGPEA